MPRAQDSRRRSEAEAHARVIARASAILSESVDVEATLRRVAEALVPTLADCSAIGAISLMMSDGARVFSEADFHLAGELGVRAALAVENARRFLAERLARQVAEEAQVRLRFLAESSLALSATHDLEQAIEHLV